MDDSLFEDKPFDDSLFEDTEFQESSAPINQDYGMLETFLGEAAQGATFGFADEIEAGLKSTLSDKDYSDLLTDIRAGYEVAAEQNPVSATTGNIAGSLASIFTPMGAIGATAKGATLGARALGAAKGGAAAGALFGAGTSEGTLATGEGRGQLVEDILAGTAAGATVGGAMPVVGKAVGTIAKETGASAAINRFIGDAVKVAQLRKQGVNLATKAQTDVDDKLAAEYGVNLEKALNRMDEDALDSAGSILKDLKQQHKDASKVYTQSFKDTVDDLGGIDAKQVTAVIDSKIDELTQLGHSDLNPVIRDLTNLKNEYLTRATNKIIKSGKSGAEKAEDALRRTQAQERVKQGLQDVQIGKATPDVVDDTLTGMQVLKSDKPKLSITDDGDVVVEQIPTTRAIPDNDFTPVKVTRGEREAIDTLNGEQLLKLRTNLNAKYAEAEAGGNSGLARYYSELRGKIDNVLEDKADEVSPTFLDNLNQSKAELENIFQAFKQMGITTKPIDRRLISEVDAKDIRQEYTNVLDIMKQYAGSKTSDLAKKTEMFNRGLEKMPSELQLGIKQMMSDVADEAKLLREMGTESQIGGTASTFYFSPKAWLMHGSNIMSGTYYELGGEAIDKGLADVSRSLMNTAKVAPEMIQMAGESLAKSENRVAQTYGQKLIQAANSDMKKRRAILYTLLQNKDFRDMMAPGVLQIENEE